MGSVIHLIRSSGDAVKRHLNQIEADWPFLWLLLLLPTRSSFRGETLRESFRVT